MTERRSQRLLTTSLVTSFLWFTLLVSLPGNLYLTNLESFTLHFRELLAFVLPLFCLATISSTAIFIALSPSAHKRLVALVFALSLLVWFQGNILVWQYGPLDGKQILWDDYWVNGALDGPLWLIVLGFSLIKSDSYYRVARISSSALLVLSLLAVIVTANQAETSNDSHTIKNFVIDQSNKYDFSTNRNAILIVLDEFQSDIFHEIITEDEGYAEIFAGFTYFKNSLSGSNYTELAIPALLTGRIFDNSEPRSAFLERSYLTDSITTILKSNGYLVDIYPWVGWSNESIYFDERVASNLRNIANSASERIYTEKKAKEVLHLIDLALFRSSPHIAKKHIYNDQRWFLIRIVAHKTPRWLKETVSTDDAFEGDAFVGELSEGIRVTREAGVFKYYHLKGAHSPLVVNQDLEYTSQTFDDNRQNYIAQAKASLKSLGVFLDLLRASGIYDQSLVIVTGDHGSGMPGETIMAGPRRSPIETKIRRHPYGRSFREDKARGIPLLLGKKFNSKGRMSISDAPVSLLDIPATIVSELGLQATPTGLSMFEVDSGMDRTRRYGAFSFSQSSSEYVAPIVFYSVDGDSWLDESWRVEGISAPPK